MNFKNLRFYTVDLTDLIDTLKDDEKIEDALEKAKFTECPKDQLYSVGFVEFFEGYVPKHISSGHNHFFKVGEEAKLIPSSVIKTTLKKAVAAKEAELSRYLKKEEKEALKAAISNRLLSQAFTTYKELIIWVNTDLNIVGVGTTSAKKAEMAIALLRDALTTFPAKILAPMSSPEDVMTNWLKDTSSIPVGFQLGNDATLKSVDEDGETIKAIKADLTSDEIAVHLDGLKQVKEISLVYDDAVNIKLTSDLVIKSFKPTDTYLEKNLPEKTKDEKADEESMLFLQTELLTEICSHLLKIFKCQTE